MPRLSYRTSTAMPKPPRIEVVPDSPGDQAKPTRGRKLVFCAFGALNVISPVRWKSRSAAATAVLTADSGQFVTQSKVESEVRFYLPLVVGVTRKRVLVAIISGASTERSPR